MCTSYQPAAPCVVTVGNAYLQLRGVGGSGRTSDVPGGRSVRRFTCSDFAVRSNRVQFRGTVQTHATPPQINFENIAGVGVTPPTEAEPVNRTKVGTGTQTHPWLGTHLQCRGWKVQWPATHGFRTTPSRVPGDPFSTEHGGILARRRSPKGPSQL